MHRSILFKRIISCFLSLVFIVGTFPVTLPASAFEPAEQSYVDAVPQKTVNKSEAVDASTADELELALKSEASYIRITADFELDRTFYITGDTVIYTEEAHTLSRSASFGKDIFVIGEDAAGNSSVLKHKPAFLTLGDPESDAANMLVIDGNRDNMLTDVVGTVLFIANSSTVEICENVSVINAYKPGNERTLDAAYGLSYPERIGGAVSIIASGSLNIFGGSFTNNAVSADGEISERGGVIYSFGNLNVYGGTFESNTATRGGVIFSYRVMRLYGGSFVGNYAAENGGAVSLANSQYCELRAGYGSQNGSIVFRSNSAGNNGGALYSSAQGVISIYESTEFIGNSAVNGSGGAICSYGQVTARNAVFTENTALTRGGAIYLSVSEEELTTRIADISNSVFTYNSASDGGALTLFSGSASYKNGAIAVVSDSVFASNSATDGEAASGAGGAIYASRKSRIELNNTKFTANTAVEEGGAIYATGESTVTVNDSVFDANEAVLANKASGGAVSVHSVYFTADNTAFKNNTATKNGAALYISYVGDSEINSVVSIKNSSFSQNRAENYGGAVYYTKHTVEEDVLGFTAVNTVFEANSAAVKGGAMYVTAGADVYMYDVKLQSNSVDEGDSNNNGGAIYSTEGIIEINKADFTENASGYNGGALAIYSSSKMILNNVTANGNAAGYNGGFAYNSGSELSIYNSDIKNNTANKHGGAISLHSKATAGIYSTRFTSNSSKENGGALYAYQGAAEATVHSCTFESNVSNKYGGAIFASNASILGLYKTKATNNNAVNGGVLYVTTTDTEVTLIDMTVSGNTATAGPIIYGNTTKAKLNINKSAFTDLDVNGELSSDYWSAAIANKLKVTETAATAPAYTDYTEKEVDEPAGKPKEATSVQHVFDLATNSSNAAINSAYGALEELNTSSNFMSLSTTVFDNINNGTVTVDTFVYHEDERANNGNFGEGILIYQAMLYKQAHPNEDVSIDISSFRFSVEAAVCINRSSRYFGYMRNLYGQDYDQYGFVRISYLLICAAKMGINVTVIGQLDGYPISEGDPNFIEYFTDSLDVPCDPAYEEDKLVGDFLNYQYCYWKSYDDKDATDMMHTKLCAVSHYIDMNGNEHQNAVWTSSSNLDGVNNDATNGNNKLQTATIVSDHAEIYRVSKNYLRLIAQYCDQEGVYEFRTAVNTLTTKQINALLSDSDDIPEDEQIVYLGTDSDNVFELYFSPFGGDAAVWNETYNPYCKYLRELYDSEGYIILTWNNAKFESFALGKQMEEMIISAFRKNADPGNRIYLNLENFASAEFSDLVVGEDIGYMSFNEEHFGAIHSKDLQLSYVKEGQRYYVSILNSMNLHGGSMSYQSNFLLVIKETELNENSVFFTIADETTVGIVEHKYGDELVGFPEDITCDGYIYRECSECGKQRIEGVAHRESEWMTDCPATEDSHGIQHTECIACGNLIRTRTFTGAEEASVNWSEDGNDEFSSDILTSIALKGNKMPHTFEATVQVPTSMSERVGVIAGNYELTDAPTVSFEIYSKGRVRLYCKANGLVAQHIFAEDIRSDVPVHIAVTVDGTAVSLYVDGELSEVAALAFELPDTVTNMKLGGDNRYENPHFFKGKLYSVSLFADVRTQDEIRTDAILVTSSEDDLLYCSYLRDYYTSEDGMRFNAHTDISILPSTSATPKTIEATVSVSEFIDSRAGIILGNYEGSLDGRLNLEIHEKGKVRLFFTKDGQKIDCIFKTDIRSDKPVHIAVTVDGKLARLYVNGEYKEWVLLAASLPESLEDLKLGRDNRSDSKLYFKGTIHSVALFGDVRSAEEIKNDAVAIVDSDSLIYKSSYRRDAELTGTVFTSANGSVKPITDDTPHTFEATLLVPKSLSDRAGIITGNYSASGIPGINLEIYTGGRVRLFFTDGITKYDNLFKTDIRSDEPVHIAVTADGTLATLYVNGEFKETLLMASALPSTNDSFMLGSDNRAENAPYFKGILYSAALYEDARTADEVRNDYLHGADTYDAALLYSEYYTADIDKNTGRTFTAQSAEDIVLENGTAPLTLEATVRVPTAVTERAGVIAGSYDVTAANAVNLEIYTHGQVRIYAKTNGQVAQHIFTEDIRSDSPVHIAVTVDGMLATLYVNGRLSETALLSCTLPSTVTDMKLGGDNRYGNSRYFKGTVYSVNLFSDVRTAFEIKQDAIMADKYADGLIYSADFTGNCDATENRKNHTRGNWITDREATATECGIEHIECVNCHTVLFSHELACGTHVQAVGSGISPAAEEYMHETGKLSSAVQGTFEVLMQLSPSFSARGGVLIGNYDGSDKEQLNIEIYTNGAPRLYYRSNGIAYTYLFTTDVRSANVTHLALTIDGLSASLYVNGKLAETVTTDIAQPQIFEYYIGGDLRTVAPQLFNGTVYAVSIFEDVRTASEIERDAMIVAPDEEGLIYSYYFN